MSAGDQFEAQFMIERPNIHPPRDPRPVFGRERELGLLSEAMQHSGPRVIHIHGISGIGKSTLISEFAATWRSKKGTALLLDGRKIEPTESGFQQELSRWLRLGRPTLASIVRVLSKRNEAVVIALDSYELLGLLDAWLRQVFLRRLGNNVRLILVSRFPPAPQWTETPEWRGSFRSLNLGPLNDVAAFELLRSLGADETRAGAIATFARGHPLALVMAGAASTQLPRAPMARRSARLALSHRDF